MAPEIELHNFLEDLKREKEVREKYKAITEDLVRETFPTLLPVAAPAVVIDGQPEPKKRGRPKKS